MREPDPGAPASEGATDAALDETATVLESWGTDGHHPGVPWTTAATGLRYVVLEELGRGAMGRVLRAYDPKLQREVALKEIHPEALVQGADARLVVEARAMAKLSHPHVVAVHDVEEAEPGRVVLVMEYVRGTTLRRWLSAGARSWLDVRAMLLQAGRGLAAAHAAGLLHRDFKPANVLVGEDGVVKVMDFGLAKATREAVASEPRAVGLSGATDELTQAGTVMGTPRYMAPEQHFGEELTPAADQYAFCVTSWEALCGEPPFSGATTAELVQRKLEARPTWSGPSVPRRIVDALLRGLSPDPSQRWPAMAALLEALAWDPTRHRQRWLLGAGAVGALGLVGMTVEAWVAARAARCSGAEQRLAGIWDDERRATVEASMLGTGRAYATPVWERAEQALDAYAAEWTAMHTETCEATTVRKEQSTEVMDLRMACLHRAAVELEAITDQLADADAKVVQHAHVLTAGLSPLSQCADVEALLAGVEPPRPEDADAVEDARARVADARAARQAGRYELAKGSIAAAHVVLDGVEYGPVRSELALEEGLLLDRMGEYDAAEASLLVALESASQWRQWNELGQATTRLMYVVGYQQNRLAEGLRYRTIAEGAARGDALREASVALTVGSLLTVQGKLAESEAAYRRALARQLEVLGPEHALVAASRNNLANALQAQGRYAEAEAEHRRALALRERVLGPGHPDVAASRTNLANALSSQGRLAEAEAELRAALTVREQALSPEHPDVAAVRNNLANLLSAQGKLAEAEAELRAAQALWAKALGPAHPQVAAARSNLGNVLMTQGKHAEAEAELRAALGLMQEAMGPDHPDVARARGNLASAFIAQGKHAEAEAELRVVMAGLERALGAEHPDVVTARVALASVLLDQRRAAEALVEAERAWQGWPEGLPPDARAAAAFALARAQWEAPAGSRERALALAEQALAELAGAEGEPSDRAREIEAWLAARRAP